MSLKNSFKLCEAVLDCPHADECTAGVSLWGETVDSVEYRPSPDVGGDRIDESCVLILGQNPGNDLSGEFNRMKFGADTVLEQLLWHRKGLKNEFTPSKVVEDMGLDWECVVWDNVVRCPTRDDEITDTVFKNCVDEWLGKQVLALDPDFIVTLGRHALNGVNRTFESLDMDIDDTAQTMTGHMVHSMYHYSYYMRQGTYDERMEQFRRQILPSIPEVAWA